MTFSKNDDLVGFLVTKVIFWGDMKVMIPHNAAGILEKIRKIISGVVIECIVEESPF
jgi:hypothetical protein